MFKVIFVINIKGRKEVISQGNMGFLPQPGQIINISDIEYEVKSSKVVLESISRVNKTFDGHHVLVEIERTI